MQSAEVSASSGENNSTVISNRCRSAASEQHRTQRLCSRADQLMASPLAAIVLARARCHASTAPTSPRKALTNSTGMARTEVMRATPNGKRNLLRRDDSLGVSKFFLIPIHDNQIHLNVKKAKHNE